MGGSFINTDVGKIVLTMVSNGIVSLVNNSQAELPATVENSVLVNAVGEDKTKVDIIRFNIGLRSSMSVIDAEKQHGSTNIQLSKSLSDGKDINSTGFLRRQFGFNRKPFDFLNENFYVVVKDYEKIYKISSWNIPEHSVQVFYGLVKKEYCSVKIRNSNSYHKLIFIVHVVKILDDDICMHDLYNVTFNGSKQEDVAIPFVYQITGKNVEPVLTNEFMNSIKCFGGASPNMSAAFKTQAKIVKSFKRYLNPGDTLDFRMRHPCGPGIRFDIAKNYLLRNGLQPSSYGIIVEVQGTPCEAIRFSDKSIFQGTCPGWYNYEYQKGVKVVRNSSIISDSSELGTNLLNKYAVKVYEREFLKERPLNVPADKIGENKEFRILSLSQEMKVDAGPLIESTENTYNTTSDSSLIETNFDFDEPYENEFN
jgi:hypothetical protein